MNCLSRVAMLFVVAAAVLACTAASADIYVSGGGLDDPGRGTVDAPYRTITYALENLGAETVIRVGAGLYSDAVWEEFPLSVPDGVSIIGTMGADRDSSDSAVVDAGARGTVFVLATTPEGTTATVQNLVVTNFQGPASRYFPFQCGFCVTSSPYSAIGCPVWATQPVRPSPKRYTTSCNAGASAMPVVATKNRLSSALSAKKIDVESTPRTRERVGRTADRKAFRFGASRADSDID